MRKDASESLNESRPSALRGSQTLQQLKAMQQEGYGVIRVMETPNQVNTGISQIERLLEAGYEVHAEHRGLNGVVSYDMVCPPDVNRRNVELAQSLAQSHAVNPVVQAGAEIGGINRETEELGIEDIENNG